MSRGSKPLREKFASHFRALFRPKSDKKRLSSTENVKTDIFAMHMFQRFSMGKALYTILIFVLIFAISSIFGLA